MQSSDLYNPGFPESNPHFRNFGHNGRNHEPPYHWLPQAQQFDSCNPEVEKGSKIPLRSFQWRSNVPYRYQNGQGDKGKEGEKDANNWDQYDHGSNGFFGPQLWDKAIPANSDYKFEYMDIDDFLTENNLEDEFFRKNLAASGGTFSLHTSPAHDIDKLSPSITPTHDVNFDKAVNGVTKPVNDVDRVTSPETDSSQSSEPLGTVSSPGSASEPGTPLAVKTEASDSGQHDFDPRTRSFSEDELKPQPIIKKSRKQYVPNDLKDDRYWARRRKNNLAAKRSRDARRVKENQIALRAGYLEKENDALRDELEKTRDVVETLKTRLAIYESSNSRKNE